MRAFTLIELLIYIALSTMLMTGALTSVYSVRASAQKSAEAIRIENAGAFLIGKIDAELKSSAIGEPGHGSDSQSLVLSRPDGSVTAFRQEFGTLVIERAGEVLPLSDDSVIIEKAEFVYDSNKDMAGLRNPPCFSVRIDINGRGRATSSRRSFTEDICPPFR